CEQQLDYDSRVVQRRLYEEALLKITLPALSSKMDSKWKNELQQFEQYIFSDYSSFILVRNIYDDVLQSILSKEIETAVQDAASKKSNNLLLDTSDLAISQYSLLGLTPPRSAPDSPATSARDSSAAAAEDPEPAPVVEEGGQKVPKNEPDLNTDAKPDPGVTQSRDQSTVSPSPVIVVTQQFDESAAEEASCIEETREEFQLATSAPSKMESATAEPSSTAPTDSDAAEVGTPTSDSTNPITDSPDLLMSSLSSPQSTDAPAACAQSDPPATPESSATPDLSTSVTVTEDTSDQHPCPSSSPPPCTDTSVKIRLGSLCEAIGCDSVAPSVMQTMERQTTDRAVYLTGQIKDNWEVERVKEEKQLEAAEEVE
ncbi:flocculation protein FLO11-like, partial [Plectropomus leopardus]|uniref:flocculation protein FLO11-like n=1 Tax=Plectropomus leopardus TaxID=160734 RepID=UPI001C4A9B10